MAELTFDDLPGTAPAEGAPTGRPKIVITPHEPATRSVAPAGGGMFDDIVPTKPSREVGTLEALSTGAEHGLTFGTAPNIRGLTEASTAGLSPEVATGMEAGAGYMAPVVKPLIGAARLAYDWARGHPDPSVKDAYERGRKTALESEHLANEQHPYAYLGGILAGSLGTPGFGVARGASALGRIGYGMLGGGLGGGAYGLGESLGEERGLGDTAKAVATGTGLGAGLGGLGNAALQAARPVVSRIAATVRGLRDPEAEASRRLVASIASDEATAGKTWHPLTSEQLGEAGAAGLSRGIVDVMGPQTKALGEWAATTSPHAAQALKELTQKRFEEQAPRISRYIQDMTHGGDLAADIEKTQQAARKANRPAYKQAYADGAGGMWSPELERLTGAPAVRDAMKGAVERGQNRAIREGAGAFNPGVRFDNGMLKFGQGKGAPPHPDMQFWDYTQRELRDAASAAAQAGRNEEASALFGLHGKLLDELDRMNPAFEAARSGAAGFKGVQNALEAGAQFVNTKSNIGVGEVRNFLANPRRTQAEKDLFARGFATELATKIKNSADSRNVLNSTFLNNPAAKERIEMALGPQRARELEALLRAEEVVNSTRGLYLGSPTARRVALQTAMGAGLGGAEYLGEGSFDLSHFLGAAALPALAGRGAKILDQRVAAKLGDMLASDNPAVITKGIQLVARVPRFFNALRHATGAGSRVLSGIPAEQAAQGRKDGGHVTAKDRIGDGASQPRLRGAKKAPDGKWYLPDPGRPGKFLRIEGLNA